MEHEVMPNNAWPWATNNHNQPSKYPAPASVMYVDFILTGRNERWWSLSAHEMLITSQFQKARTLTIWEGLDNKRLPTSVPGSEDQGVILKQVFFLQERVILKRCLDDLHGALESLTGALEIDHNDYECLNRYLLRDLNRAQMVSDRRRNKRINVWLCCRNQGDCAGPGVF